MLKGISIVIPTFNEEKFLPSLLKSIKLQKYPCEIIIADNNSIDKTLEIAKKYRCKITKGGIPSVARNNGAKIAKYDLLFLDADVVLPDSFLKKFLEKEGDAKTCRVEPITNNLNHRFYYMLKNLGNIIFPYHVSGQCIFIKKSIFEKTGGFDEKILFGEEHDLAKRVKFRFYYDLYVLNYPRRLEKEGTYRTLLKDIYSEIYRIFKKGNKNIYNKRYGHYF